MTVTLCRGGIGGGDQLTQLSVKNGTEVDGKLLITIGGGSVESVPIKSAETLQRTISVVNGIIAIVLTYKGDEKSIVLQMENGTCVKRVKQKPSDAPVAPAPSRNGSHRAAGAVANVTKAKQAPKTTRRRPPGKRGMKEP